MSTENHAMNVAVDEQLCAGHGRCILLAPDVFGYGDVTNRAYVLPEADPSADREAVLEAARGCPESAIVVSG